MHCAGLGSLLGILPGGGPVLASFAAMRWRRSWRRVRRRSDPAPSKASPDRSRPTTPPHRPRSLPLLTLGLPSGPVGALLLGALIVHGVQPGPSVIAKEPALFWGLVASMWIGNVMLLVLNLPLVGWWARLVRVPYRCLYPTTVTLACTGIYALNHSVLDLWLAALFGVAGYLLKARGFEPARLLLGFVLSQPLSDNFNRALVFSGGDLSTFVTHPLSAALLTIAGGALLVTALPAVKRGRMRLAQEER